MNKQEILEWLKKHNLFNDKCKYTINKDTTIDVDGNVKIIYLTDDKIPDDIKFNVVSGDFNCSYTNLTTLEGCPKEVGGDFNCDGTKINTLEYSPKKVGGDFNCSDNNLTSLEGAPIKVGGSFLCNDNDLTSLEGCPKEVGHHFDCGSNKLKSLKGCPEKVKGMFYCSDNKLANLIYMPVLNSTSGTGFPKEVVRTEQDIMKQAKSYEAGVQAYQDYLDIFGDD